jgi:3-oxoacyl-[acyl-carrier-protein] synthase II
MGTLAPNGNTTEAYWQALCNGQTGVDLITKFDASDFRVRFADEIKDFDA